MHSTSTTNNNSSNNIDKVVAAAAEARQARRNRRVDAAVGRDRGGLLLSGRLAVAVDKLDRARGWAAVAGKAAYTLQHADGPGVPLSGYVLANDVRCVWVRMDGAGGGPVLRAGRFVSGFDGVVRLTADIQVDLVRFLRAGRTDRDLFVLMGRLAHAACGLLHGLFNQAPTAASLPTAWALMSLDDFVAEDNPDARESMPEGGDAREWWYANCREVVVNDGVVVACDQEGGGLPGDGLAVLAPLSFVARHGRDVEYAVHPVDGSSPPPYLPLVEGLTMGVDGGGWVVRDRKWVPAAQLHMVVFEMTDVSRCVRPGLAAVDDDGQVPALVGGRFTRYGDQDRSTRDVFEAARSAGVTLSDREALACVNDPETGVIAPWQYPIVVVEDRTVGGTPLYYCGGGMDLDMTVQARV